jgi:LCP family protein required for cell wall assembly
MSFELESIIMIDPPLPTRITSAGYRFEVPVKSKKKRHPFRNGLLILLVFFLFFTPFRTTLLIIGIDRTPEGSDAGRSDTMILTTLTPVLPKMTLLSIPRDLWVGIPGYGENRINTAHYFAELDAPGSGMRAAVGVVEANFGIDVPYVLRLKFDTIVTMVDAMGGVTINLPEAMIGFEAGEHHLDGTTALRFVRDRAGSDDFARQKRGQMFISAVLKNMFNPLKWVRIPFMVNALLQGIDTNIPFYLWPRILYGTAYSAVFGFDTRTFEREMVTPWVTDQGAQVLLPNWERINPLIAEIFRR